MKGAARGQTHALERADGEGREEGCRRISRHCRLVVWLVQPCRGEGVQGGSGGSGLWGELREGKERVRKRGWRGER